MVYLAVFCTAVSVSQYMAVLLSAQGLLLVLSLGVLAFLLLSQVSRRYGTLALLACAAFVFGQFSATHVINQRVPQPLEGKEVTLEVELVSLPVNKGRYQQFAVKVLSGEKALVDKKLLLNNYQAFAFSACEQAKVAVKLKRPHGLANQGGFDYEAHLLEQGIVAKGYIKRIDWVSDFGFCFNRIRHEFREALDAHLAGQKSRWLKALAIGDKSQLHSKDRKLLNATGVGHLFVISGLHIGFVAFSVFGFVMLLRRLGLGLFWRVDWRPAAYLAGFSAALFYGAMAGFSLPVQRALIMLAVFFSTHIIGVTSSVWTRYFTAMALLLLLNPQSVLNIGFILSFTALAYVLLLQPYFTTQKSIKGKMAQLVMWQCCLSFLLLPVMYYFFKGWPLLSPLTNLVAIPIISMLVVPLLLGGFMLWLVSGVFNPLLNIAALIVEQTMRLMVFLSEYCQALFVTQPVSHNTWLFLLMASFVVFIKPRPVAFALLLLCLSLSAFYVKEKPMAGGELALDVIDVGQGLSVLLQTTNYTLLYDLGASWPQGSMVEMAVLPVLKSKVIDTIHTLVISHLDNDHLGDPEALVAGITVKQLLASEPLTVGDLQAEPCFHGRQFSVDGFVFRFINPLAEKAGNRNDNSCVLLVTGYGKTVLLSGDISHKQERKLMAYLPRQIDVLVAPHHGSKYSSSGPWVEKLNDAVVIFSAGFKNRFKHPHPDTVERYKAVNSRLFNTAGQGQVSVHIDAQGNLSVETFRQSQPRYWRVWQSL